DPWIARSYGFALSVLATSGLLLVAPWLVARTTAVLPRALAIALIVPLAAQLACLTALVRRKPQLPVDGVAANILAAPVVAPATILGVLAALLAPHWPEAAVVLLSPAAWCAEWVATVATTLAGLPGAAVAWPVAALAGGVLLVAVLLLGRRRLIARVRGAAAREGRTEMSAGRGRVEAWLPLVDAPPVPRGVMCRWRRWCWSAAPSRCSPIVRCSESPTSPVSTPAGRRRSNRPCWRRPRMRRAPWRCWRAPRCSVSTGMWWSRGQRAPATPSSRTPCSSWPRPVPRWAM